MVFLDLWNPFLYLLVDFPVIAQVPGDSVFQLVNRVGLPAPPTAALFSASSLPLSTLLILVPVDPLSEVIWEVGCELVWWMVGVNRY